jgi:hypothetical protein
MGTLATLTSAKPEAPRARLKAPVWLPACMAGNREGETLSAGRRSDVYIRAGIEGNEHSVVLMCAVVACNCRWAMWQQATTAAAAGNHGTRHSCCS